MQSVVTPVLVGIAAFVAGLFMSQKWFNRLPGPLPLPFVGTRWHFWLHYKMDKLHEAYEDMFRRYGPVFAEVAPGGGKLVCIADSSAISKVLRGTKAQKSPFRPPTEIVKVYRERRPDRYASTGLVNAQGSEWEHLRQHLTVDLCSWRTLTVFLPHLNLICDDLVALLDSNRDANGCVTDFEQLTNRMGLESVCGLMLGARLGFLERHMTDRAATLAAAVKQHFTAQRDSYYGAPFWKYVPTELYERFVRSEDTIHKIVSELIDETLENNAALSQDNEGLQTIFYKILSNPDLDMRDKKTGIIDFISAGIETLANTLVFLLYLLSGRPDWQQRIREELPNTDNLTIDDLSEARALRAAMRESFRMTPTAPFLARLLDEPVPVNGHTVPAGTFVLLHTRAACLQEENFFNATTYLPERWMPGNNITPNNTNLVALFGRGRRMCPGKRFVELELQLLLAKIIRHWNVVHEGPLDVEFNFLLAPKGPVTFRLVPVAQ